MKDVYKPMNFCSNLM